MASATRAPQDRQTKAAPEEKPAGWELLKPFDQVPAWDQAELIATVQPVMSQVDDEGHLSLDATTFDFRVLGNLAKTLRDVAALDPAEYTKFVSGAGGLERAAALAITYVELLGE